jgi:hypothetical protein
LLARARSLWRTLGAALLLTVTAFGAMIRPARWALAVDPAMVLREE